RELCVLVAVEILECLRTAIGLEGVHALPLLDRQALGGFRTVERDDVLARGQDRATVRLDEALGLGHELLEIRVEVLGLDAGADVDRLLALGLKGRNGETDAETDGERRDDLYLHGCRVSSFVTNVHAYLPSPDTTSSPHAGFALEL